MKDKGKKIATLAWWLSLVIFGGVIATLISPSLVMTGENEPPKIVVIVELHSVTEHVQMTEVNDDGSLFVGVSNGDAFVITAAPGGIVTQPSIGGKNSISCVGGTTTQTCEGEGYTIIITWLGIPAPALSP